MEDSVTREIDSTYFDHSINDGAQVSTRDS